MMDDLLGGLTSLVFLYAVHHICDNSWNHGVTTLHRLERDDFSRMQNSLCCQVAVVAK